MTVNYFDPNQHVDSPIPTHKPAMSETQPAATAGRVGFISLGCPKALVDSERILTQLKLDGYDVVASYEDADIVVVNTCGFIDSAKQESLDAISEAMAENGKVIVTGCMGKGQDAELILRENPGVLAVTGAHAYAEVVGAVHQWLPPTNHLDAHRTALPPQGVKLTPTHYSYLKIAEGCNHKCTFCIIPDMRGKLVSRPANDVLDEAERLVAAGTKELLVVSQDTSAYGIDLKTKTAFWQGRPVKNRMLELCQMLGEMGVWVRLHYVYPYPHVDDVIPLMAAGKILPYLDIPFQHASPKILKAMKRPAASESNLERIKAWRSICPELTIRSTFIVGFPGETEEDFQLLLDFIEAAQLDRVGCFTYSPVEGAKANEFADQVPEDVKEDRKRRFMEAQAAISEARLQAKVGTVQWVLVDEVTAEGAVARSMADAPEIDGCVFIDDATHLAPGDLVQVEIEEADEYDLWGHLV